jgi:hypothetical protein
VPFFDHAQGERTSERTIVGALGERAFALLIVVLGLPNCLPMPPPIPLLCGLLLVFVALQILFGLHAPWLPQRVLNHTIAHADLVRAVDRAVPWLRWLERFARPRLHIFDNGLGMRIMGASLLAFALALVFAAPFIGQIPLGIAVCLLGLGMVERDGVVVAAGFVVGLVGSVLSLGFILALITGANAIL